MFFLGPTLALVKPRMEFTCLNYCYFTCVLSRCRRKFSRHAWMGYCSVSYWSGDNFWDSQIPPISQCKYYHSPRALGEQMQEEIKPLYGVWINGLVIFGPRAFRCWSVWKLFPDGPGTTMPQTQTYSPGPFLVLMGPAFKIIITVYFKMIAGSLQYSRSAAVPKAMGCLREVTQ